MKFGPGGTCMAKRFVMGAILLWMMSACSIIEASPTPAPTPGATPLPTSTGLSTSTSAAMTGTTSAPTQAGLPSSGPSVVEQATFTSGEYQVSLQYPATWLQPMAQPGFSGQDGFFALSA